MKWTLGLKGFRRARSEQSQDLSTPTASSLPRSGLSFSTTRLRKARPAPMPLDSSVKLHVDVRLESGRRMSASEQMSSNGSEMRRESTEAHVDEGYGSAMDMDGGRSRVRGKQLGEGFGGPVEVVSFASPFEQDVNHSHILPRTFSTRLPSHRPSSSTSPSSESDQSSKLSLSTPPSSRASSPAITRSSTINTISSTFHARRSSSSTRSHLSYSPPSSPTSSLLSLPKLSTRLDEDGRRVISRRRRSVGPEPEKVRRTKKSFGVGDDGDSSASAEEREAIGRAGLARVRSSMPPLSSAYDEADDESMELLMPPNAPPASGRPPSRRNSAPSYQHSRRRTYTTSPLSPLNRSTTSTTPRGIVIIPLASTTRRSSAHSLSFTPLQHSFPISNIEESPAGTPRPASLRRPSAVAFADDTPSRLPRSPILPSLAKVKRRETMSVEPSFAVGRAVDSSSEGRKSLEQLEQSVWEQRQEWWEIGDERERGRGCLKVVNPDEGAGSTSTSRRPSVETPRTDRCSYYSCSSELAILSADFAV